MIPGPFADLIDDPLGRVIERGDGLYDIVLERRLKLPVEKVWAALTVPERIADWFTEVELEPRVGGRYSLRFSDGYAMDGVVTAFEPSKLLAHTWPHETHPDSVVRYELAPDGDGCRLTLTQTAIGRPAFNALPGWHTFLEALPGAANGLRTPWSRDRERRIGERYRGVLPA
jgi:uncharacterized protein YndB with AHSA1/START domain